ncbi:MAG: CZB domain-containing protein [Rhodospirillales bacterium]|nr:CZB domain-containing protein [Rhodospirillales bacterium]
MTLLSLLRAHGEWVTQLRESLYGDGEMTEASAGDDQSCALGQWLGGLAVRYREMPEFRSCAEIHARFHRRAAYCLWLIETGRRTEALAETHDSGELRRLSRALVQSLQLLNRALPKHAHRDRLLAASRHE